MEPNVSAVSPLGDAIDGTVKPRRRSRKSRSGPVETIIVDRRVWAAALKIANGDPKRIRIVSRTRVEVTD